MDITGLSGSDLEDDHLSHGFGHELKQSILHQNLLVFLWATIIAGVLTLLLPNTMPWLPVVSGYSVYILLNIIALVICRNGRVILATAGYTLIVLFLNALAVIVTGNLDTHIIVSIINLILLNGFIVGARGALIMTAVGILMTIGGTLIADGTSSLGLGGSSLAQLNVATGTSLLATGFVMASGIRLLQRSVQTSSFAIAQLQKARDVLDERHRRTKELSRLGELILRSKSVDKMLLAFVEVLSALPELSRLGIFDQFGASLLEPGEHILEDIDLDQLISPVGEESRSGLSLYSVGVTHSYWMNLGGQNEITGILLVEVSPHKNLSDDQELFICAAAGIIGSGLKRANSEQILRQAQRMETIGKLAGSVAHDFNNMLTTIIGCNELTRLSLEGEHPAQAHIDTSTIASQQAAALVNKLLTFAHARPRKPERFELSEFLESRELFLRNFMNENTQLVFDIDDTEFWIHADPVDIEQVFVNLLINARNALSTGGKIQVKLRHETASTMKIEVSDTGPGIPEKDRLRVFEPFFTTREGSGGTGLGLATVKAIVIENDGEIGLHDSVEGGASVHILWPLDTKVEGLVSKKAETKILPLPKLNILVVDDDPLVRSTITKLIEELGLTATSLESPLQALDILKQGDDFDLIITDFIMPEMNGAEFIERLRESGDSRPIILMSGYDDYEELTNKVEYLPATRIQKPFTLDQLRELLAGAPT